MITSTDGKAALLGRDLSVTDPFVTEPCWKHMKSTPSERVETRGN